MNPLSVHNDAHHDGHCGGHSAAPEQREALVSCKNRSMFIDKFSNRLSSVQLAETATSHFRRLSGSLCVRRHGMAFP